MKKLYFLTMILNLITLSGYCQDQIVKTSKDTIRCQIKEIGDDEVKYTQKDLSGEVIYGIDKNKVSRIIFSNGKELTIKDSMYNPDQYKNQHKNALKVGFLSPLVGATSFTFEHSIKPGSSVEATLGIIGLGVVGNRNAQGLYLKFGYKFIKNPDFYQKGTRFDHILKGAYIRPEFSFANYSVNSTLLNNLSGGVLNNGGARETNTMVAFMLNIGKQWIFNDRFLIDWFAGLGYGFGHAYENNGSHFAFIGGVPDFPLAITAGLRIGILL